MVGTGVINGEGASVGTANGVVVARDGVALGGGGAVEVGVWVGLTVTVEQLSTRGSRTTSNPRIR